ncbi:hypothetical protein E7Z57_19960 (plasmid) [Ralstonia pseudosolanacearum]|uniref:Uncharacterized protein n=1 Tax=Ralstonia solanacearum TaxID=305 RepID=A0AA92EGI2_RALSL|nr:hypothetical protein E7Z57_19960 [Ralstonia pseudosolanacearum]
MDTKIVLEMRMIRIYSMSIDAAAAPATTAAPAHRTEFRPAAPLMAPRQPVFCGDRSDTQSVWP